MTIAQVNEIETTKQQLIAKRAQICKLYDVFGYKSSEEYSAALVAVGLNEDAGNSEIKNAEKVITEQLGNLPKVSMKDFLTWKNVQ